MDKINASFETINVYDIYRDCVNVDNSSKVEHENFFKSFKGNNNNNNRVIFLYFNRLSYNY
jgi:hypothetical protein